MSDSKETSSPPYLSGKAGDVTSVDQVTDKAEETLRKPATETVIADHIAHPAVETSAWFELKNILRQMSRSGKARRIFIMIGCLALFLIINVIAEIRLNKWSGAFYQAIEKRQFEQVGVQ